MKRAVFVCAVLLLLLVPAYFYWRKPLQVDPGPDPINALPVSITFENGLNPAERQEFYHLAEGSEVYPLTWLRVLENKTTGKMFLDDVERFGFLPDPNNPDKLPIGLTAAPARGLEPLGKMVGLTCAACHVGEMTYQGSRIRIDGAPNLLNTRLFFANLVESAQATATDPGKLIAFLARLHDERADQKAVASTKVRDTSRKLMNYLAQKNQDALSRVLAPLVKRLIEREQATEPYDFAAELGKASAADPTAFRQRLLQGANLDELQPALDQGSFLQTPLAEIEKTEETIKNWLEEIFLSVRLLRSRAAFLKQLGRVGKEDGTDWGPGRVDAFGSARTFLFDPAYAPLNAVRYPHLWGIKTFGWFHYDSNTTSLLERNFGQALGVGAVYDPKSSASTLLPLNLHRLEILATQITPPAWPEKVFGAIDQARVKRGEEVFKNNCAACHPMLKPGEQNPGTMYALSEIGTDPNRATMFTDKLPANANAPYANMPFHQAIGQAMDTIKTQAFTQLTKEQQALFAKDPVAKWQALGKYVGRPLVGVWATAPYLHNGSVPTLYDLLQPVEKRPTTFTIGNREYDPIKLGYVTEPKDEKLYLFNTAGQGNRNSGHEYGTTLPEAAKTDLLEYLKAN